jgi:thioredoxin reductase (NADPH)
LRVIVLDGRAPGGQAGSSSRIENYFGSPTGLSGRVLRHGFNQKLSPVNFEKRYFERLAGV